MSAHYLWQRLEIAAAGNEILTAIMEKTARRGKRNDDTLISLIIPKNLLLLMRGKSDCGRRERESLSLSGAAVAADDDDDGNRRKTLMVMTVKQIREET